MEHELRKKIILKLIHAPRLTYNELWCKEGESNAFAYHLKKLEDEGLVEKFEDGYGLTAEGKKHSAYIEGDTGSMAELPTPTVIILVRKGDLILAQERRKEPFYGYWSWPSGKINFGWNPEECAIRDLKEETGLVAQHMKLRALEHIKTHDDGKLLHHHLIWLYEATQWSGELKATTHKARNAFMTVEEYKQAKRFPGDFLVEKMTTTSHFFTVDAERHMKNGIFTEFTLLSAQEFEPKQ